ncbi:unnamed protein product (macronuclear) [Paramecium tetraurelia]|uniref:Transmembrane protein n=1 Tax=Paramecium tetraurelia TaxID=5888 RepID=A0CUA2_PARTE|nr:uncharacterized protein GSPATT00010568001 [Paramecium tetraurelia]CAK74369.1 unnamed protein product [Paramecium tetraurelia]|eukprot:XP_001441766.1 hypothetical protein (macronuclear) [Paramecium tetraurelia strain d4-2]
MINQYLYEECNEFSIKFIIALLTLKLFIKSLDFIDYIQIQLIILMQLCFKTQSSNLSSNIITCYFLVQDNLQRFQQSNLQYLFSLNYTKRIYDFLNCYYVSYFSHNNSIFQWHFLFFQQLNNLQLRAKKKNSTNNDINFQSNFLIQLKTQRTKSIVTKYHLFILKLKRTPKITTSKGVNRIQYIIFTQIISIIQRMNKGKIQYFKDFNYYQYYKCIIKFGYTKNIFDIIIIGYSFIKKSK